MYIIGVALLIYILYKVFFTPTDTSGADSWFEKHFERKD